MENAPPLPQPTPHTCPHCGFGLEELPEFCPRCGEKLRTKPTRSPLGLVSTLFLVLGMLFFGAMGACGGVVTVSALSQSEYREVFLMFSLPCLILGMVVFIACLKQLIRGGKP